MEEMVTSFSTMEVSMSNETLSGVYPTDGNKPKFQCNTVLNLEKRLQRLTMYLMVRVVTFILFRITGSNETTEASTKILSPIFDKQL